MDKKEKLWEKMESLRRRIAENNYDIEWSEDSYLKKSGRGDNTFCKNRLKELEKEYERLELNSAKVNKT